MLLPTTFGSSMFLTLKLEELEVKMLFKKRMLISDLIF